MSSKKVVNSILNILNKEQEDRILTPREIQDLSIVMLFILKKKKHLYVSELAEIIKSYNKITNGDKLPVFDLSVDDFGNFTSKNIPKNENEKELLKSYIKILDKVNSTKKIISSRKNALKPTDKNIIELGRKYPRLIL